MIQLSVEFKNSDGSGSSCIEYDCNLSQSHLSVTPDNSNQMTPVIIYSWYTCDTTDQGMSNISTISEMEGPIYMTLTIKIRLNM